jgi:hypothetical protein
MNVFYFEELIVGITHLVLLGYNSQIKGIRMDSEYSSHENVWWFEVPHSRAKWRALVLGIVNRDFQSTSKLDGQVIR